MGSSRVFRRRLALTTILTISPFMFYGRQAAAACVASPSPTIVCSGDSTVNTITQVITTDNADVSTASGFGVTAPSDGVVIIANGHLQFTDNNASAIEGTVGVGLLVISTGGAGATPGAITITTGAGGSVKGGATGIEAQNNGAGALVITANGDVTGTGASGIYARNSANGAALTISTGAASEVTGRFSGIYGSSFGSGDLTVIADHKVTATNGTAILARAMGAGDLTITTGAASVITGMNGGIDGQNFGTGDLVITANGEVETISNSLAGIGALNSSFGRNLVITTGAESSITGGTGIFGTNSGTGDFEIIVNGKVEAKLTTPMGRGISAVNDAAAGKSIITTGVGSSIMAAYGGIYAVNFGKGDLIITVDGDVEATAGHGTGIYARNGSSTSDGFDTGLVITTGAESTVTGGRSAIDARNVDAGNLSITVNGDAKGTTNSGIYARNSGGPNSDSIIKVGATGLVQGGLAGISAVSLGGQDINIINEGEVRTVSGLSQNVAIKTKGGAAVIENKGTLTGTVSTGSFDDKLANRGTWNMADGKSDFGGGADELDNTLGGSVIAADDLATVETTLFANLETFTNRGVLTLSDGGAGDITTIAGNFVGQGGTIVFDTVLGDDSSPTDLLIIEGAASGQTSVIVNNVGGLGGEITGDGIKLVQVDGASTGSFTLGKPLVLGSYSYGLFLGGMTDPIDGDWYLRQAGLSPVLGAYETLPQILLSMSSVGTLRQRLGAYGGEGPDNRQIQPAADRLGPAQSGAALWTRIEAAHGHYEPGKSTTDSDYDLTQWRLRSGFDALIYESAEGDRMLAGVTVQYGTAAADLEGDADMSIDGAAYGFGVVATWLGGDGFYADGQAQLTWFDSDLDSSLGALDENNDGFGYALSLETGRRFAAGSGFAVTPQMQLVYSEVDFDGFTDPFGAEISLRDGDSLRGRLGIEAERTQGWTAADGTASLARFYGIADLSYEFLDGTAVAAGDVDLIQEPDELWGEAGLGGAYGWNNGTFELHGEAALATGLARFADSYTVSGTLGLRANW
jgi:outer membrane autotransporter protein